MATKKQTPSGATPEGAAAQHDAAYERLIGEFNQGMELLRAGDFAAARDRFEAIDREQGEERVIGDRARIYASICAQRLAGEPEAPRTPEECYQRAVVLSNNHDSDGAIRLLDQALHSEPNSTKLLYARASAWAIKGNVEAAVGDLRQAVNGDPQLRFQAVNDPDFEKIREEPTFIDIIEPTPAGV